MRRRNSSNALHSRRSSAINRLKIQKNTKKSFSVSVSFCVLECLLFLFCNRVLFFAFDEIKVTIHYGQRSIAHFLWFNGIAINKIFVLTTSADILKNKIK